MKNTDHIETKGVNMYYTVHDKISQRLKTTQTD